MARNGSPVILGLGNREMFVASDAAALVRHTEQVVYLNDGEIAVVGAEGFETSTLDAAPVHKTPVSAPADQGDYDKAGHDHYMIKEIAEQPDAVQRMLQGRLDTRFNSAPFRRPQPDAARAARHPAYQDPRLRLGLYRRLQRRLCDRAHGPHSSLGRTGLGVSLPAIR